MSGEQKSTPIGWACVPIQDICEINPTLDKRDISDDLTVSFVPMPSVDTESGKIDVSQNRYFREVKKGYTPFQKGDVLFAKITPCMENGKMAVVPELTNDIGFGSTEFHVLRAYTGIDPKWIYYFVSAKSFRGEAEHNMTGAVGQRRVPKAHIEKSLIPLPPLAEQKRIVAQIEVLFEKIDEGEKNLKAVAPYGDKALGLISSLRQSILKKAFSGGLVPQDPNDEPASVLLSRIRAHKIKTPKIRRKTT